MARRGTSAMSREARNRRRKHRHVNQHRAHARPRRRARPALKSWTTALVASTALGAGWPARVIAGARPESGASPAWALPAQTSPTAGAQPIRRFDIAPGPLSEVLVAFAGATGVRVTLSVESIGMITSPGVTGTFTVQDALARLLDGTSVTCRFTAPDVATLEFRAVAASVDVTGQAPAAPPVSPKYVAPLVDTPQSIDVISSQVMAEQGTTTLRDALRNVSGISLAAGEGGAQGDNLTIRGFTARNDLFIDGMRDFGSYYRDPFNTEAVEVLQGPSSVTFGRGSTGGVVNQATKAPQLRSFVTTDTDLGTDLTRRVTVDMGTPVAALGPGAAFRLNLMGTDSDVAGRDVAQNRRFGLAPSLALGIGSATRWTFNYLHQTANDIPDYGVPWLFNGPAPVNHENYYGFASGNYLRTNDDIATTKVEHDVNDQVTVRDQFRYAHYTRDALITEAQIATPVTLATPLDAMTVNRHEIGVNSVESFLDDQLDLVTRFQTAGIAHTLVSGVEASRETSDPTRPTYTNVPTTSLVDPDPAQPFAGTATITSQVITTAVSVAAYVLDTARMGEHWELTGGVRFDRFATDYSQSVAPVSAFSRVDALPTWRAAVVYKPTPFGSVYADAGTSFNPSAESLSLSAATANLPPEQNQTYEVGTKWNLAHDQLSVRGAVFRTEKTNAREPDPNNPLLDVLAGNERVDGVQVDASGYVTRRWELLASYARLDSEVVSSNYYPGSVGAQLANVPQNTFNAWTTYAAPHRWQVGAGTNHVSSRTASSTVPLDPTTGLVKQVPGYWVFNAMARRPLGPHLDLQLNANNLANAYYYDEPHPAHIVLGPGRSLLLGLKVKF
jgi:catecholate siderophore receptor